MTIGIDSMLVGRAADSRYTGYTRSLFDGEDVDADRRALIHAGASRLIEDSHGHARPRLTAWIDQARTGDTLIFTSLERIGPRATDIVRTLVLLHDRGIEWRCADHPDLHVTGMEVLHALDDAQRRIVSGAMKVGLQRKPTSVVGSGVDRAG